MHHIYAPNLTNIIDFISPYLHTMKACSKTKIRFCLPAMHCTQMLISDRWRWLKLSIPAIWVYELSHKPVQFSPLCHTGERVISRRGWLSMHNTLPHSTHIVWRGDPICPLLHKSTRTIVSATNTEKPRIGRTGQHLALNSTFIYEQQHGTMQV